MRWRVSLLAVPSMAALAAIDGTSVDERIKGTNARDQLTGRGDDVLIGLRSADNLNGGGRDTPSTRARRASPPGTSSTPGLATTWSGPSTVRPPRT